MENKIANPGPLGLLSFGMTTILLNIHNMGFFPLCSVIVSMGILLGGMAQIIAGIMEFKRNNLFSATAFTAYGTFWLTLVGIWLLPELSCRAAGASDPAFVGWYLFLWGLFSLFMWIGTFGKSKVLQFVFLSLICLFMLLAIHNWTESHCVLTIAGAVGVICGSSAFYLAVAELLYEVRGKHILPF